MIIYNVTCNLDPQIADEWLRWMLNEHIPKVMETGCFDSFKVLKLLSNAEDDMGINYAMQYSTSSMERYAEYRDNFAPALQLHTKEKYGESVLAFRSLLEEIM